MHTSEYIDCSNFRLGDRIALAWYAQQRRLATDQSFGLVDSHPTFAHSFPLERYFPLTFRRFPDVRACESLKHWDPGNLWLTATNVFAKTGSSGHFEFLPVEVIETAAALRRRKQRSRVLIHVLDDAPYNFARNWKRSDADALIASLRKAHVDVVVLNPVRGAFIGNFDRMLAEMLAADLFIGGDSGPSHAFALLCADKPQIAVYPDMAADRKTYAPLQRELGLPFPWCSLPLRANLAVVQLERARTLAWNGWKPRNRRVGRFDASDVGRLALQLITSTG